MLILSDYNLGSFSINEPINTTILHPELSCSSIITFDVDLNQNCIAIVTNAGTLAIIPYKKDFSGNGSLRLNWSCSGSIIATQKIFFKWFEEENSLLDLTNLEVPTFTL